MDTPAESQRKVWDRLSTLTSFVSRICFARAQRSDSESVNGLIVLPPALDFTRVRAGGVKKIMSTYLGGAIMLLVGGIAYLLGGLWLTVGLLRAPVYVPGKEA